MVQTQTSKRPRLEGPGGGGGSGGDGNGNVCGPLQKADVVGSNPGAAVSSSCGAGLSVGGRDRSEGEYSVPRVPGRSGNDGFPAAAGGPAAQPAAGGAAVRVVAHPAGGSTHGLRAAEAATARQRRGPPSARPRGSAPGLTGSPRRAVQGHFHAGTPPRLPGPYKTTTGSAEGPERQRVSTDCTLPGRGHVPSLQ